jgi:predicted RNA-binding Zn ribbon-like protein
VTKKAAPGELELVRSFVNTLNLEDGTDELADSAKVARWLEANGLLERGTARVLPVDQAHAVGLREALRSLLLENNGFPGDPSAAAVLDEAARRARLELRFLPEGRALLAPGRTGADGAFGRLLAIVARAMESGTWRRLKACRAETCEWAFYDRTKNRSGVWCQMEECGNRAKVRAYRARKLPA